MADYLLNKKVILCQPKTGFRCGLDSVLVSSIMPVLQTGRILDMGCGVFPIGLCYAKRVETEVKIIGIEKNADFVWHANKNIATNTLQHRMHVIHADIKDRPFLANSFDGVITNPPFERAGSTCIPKTKLKDVATIEGTVRLDAWLEYALLTLKSRGILCIIHKMQRLDAILHALHGKAGEIHIVPIQSKENSAPKRVLVRARKSIKTGTVMHKPLIIHRTDNTYQEIIQEILDGKAEYNVKNLRYNI